MVTDTDIDTPPTRRTIILIVAGAAAAAFLILFAGILPAEYHRDPLGLGKATGIAQLWAPAEQNFPAAAPTAQVPASTSYYTKLQAITVDVPLKAGGDPERGDEVEYKVRLKKGASYVYAWHVDGIANPEEFYTEFHGETAQSGKAMTVAYYRKATGTRDSGVLTAPFDGVHGWFFQNQSVKPVTVKLTIMGFFDLIPAGRPGNEAGLRGHNVPGGESAQRSATLAGGGR